MSVLKKHHRAAHYGHYYECLVKFKGVAYNKVIFRCHFSWNCKEM